MIRLIPLLTLSLLPLPALAQSPPGYVPITRYYGPTFLTLDPDQPEVAAVDVDGDGRIVGMYSELPVHDDLVPSVELPGVLAVPGLHDAHLHIEGIGRATERVDLNGSVSPAEVVERVEAFMLENPEVTTIRGRGWDQSRFPDNAFPTSGDLSALGDDHIVVLTRVDGHAVWVNDAALALSGIAGDTPDPDGGRIERDGSGAPTGVFIDNAIGLVTAHLPGATPVEHERWLRAGMARAAEAGLVAVHDMGLSTASYEILLRVQEEAALPIRVFVYLYNDDDMTSDYLDRCGEQRGRVTLMGVKLYADGAMGSRGAALFEDYSDDPGNRGLLLTPEEEMNARVLELHAAGCQVAIHAIGDRGNHVALQAFAAAQGDGQTRRHRIEHVQLLSATDFPIMRTQEIVASMQPTHATSDMRWAEDRVGPERIAGAYAWRTMLESEVHLAFGSDAPVEDVRPALGIYAAVTRQDADGSPDGGWRPGEMLNVEEAISAFTAGAAYAVLEEDTLGSLTVGRLFDVTVFDRDPRAEPVLWLEAEVTVTVVAGPTTEPPERLP
jgi:predicted amidohydrolase YtcJ